MAVSSPIVPNLAGSYENIQRALEQSANIASKDTGTMGAVASVVSPLGEEAQQRRGEVFKATIEDQLNKNKSQYAAQAEGKSLYTQEDMEDELKREHPKLDPKYYPQLPKQGVWLKPEEKTALEEHGLYNESIDNLASGLEKTDPTKANALRLMARMKDSQGINMILGLGKMGHFTEPGTGREVMTVNGQPMGYMDEVFGKHLSTGDNSATPLISDWKTFRTQNPNGYKDVITRSNKFPTSVDVKGYTNALDNVQYIEKAAKENTKGASINIRARLEQAAGGISANRISSKLLQSEGYSPAWADQMTQWLQSGGTGQLSSENQKAILAQATSEKSLKKQQLTSRVKAEADDAQFKYGLHPDFAVTAFSKGVEQYLQSEKPTGGGDQLKSAITNYLKSKKLDANTANIKSVADQLQADTTGAMTKNLLSKYGQ